MTMQATQYVRILDLLAPVFLKGRQQHLLGVVMLGKRAGRADNSHNCSPFPAPGHSAARC